jgi:hypothetical protein
VIIVVAAIGGSSSVSLARIAVAQNSSYSNVTATSHYLLHRELFSDVHLAVSVNQCEPGFRQHANARTSACVHTILNSQSLLVKHCTAVIPAIDIFDQHIPLVNVTESCCTDRSYTDETVTG